MVLIGWYHALRERPDCIICFHLNFMPAVLPLARLLRSPYVGVLHGIEAWNPLPASRRRALASADWLYAVSRFTLRSSAARHGLDLAKASLLPCSFDESRFSPGPKPDNLLSRYGLHIDQPIALTVARVDRSERYKGHETMLAAMPGILNRCPNMRYIVAGTGDDLGYLKSEALRLGVADSVIFTGFIPTEELPDLYRLCDIFVMPSKAEGFGIVFLEAMASGRPVIAGNQDGSTDALDQGRLGVLVDPDDKVALADAVLSILDQKYPNKLLFQPMALSAAVKAAFGFEAFKARLAAPLQKLMPKNRPPYA